ncbi:MFS general substrate transporter [Dothidotthia symphoricarpi CBS 119687]|uniref:MFS general substrate transporter n=1 Tax=Dothidotthia symphoricarpi CBS 119687 TaxID=1392245 RepID=A0A6A6A5X5_9PLEO|nr:MFS general substrate transporter [Dothidotthia symphoricarpi CBS 119687]KAF2126317.1 MFS general substrate transporter [Dothidotthia symphoricarpi CBS 119687]
MSATRRSRRIQQRFVYGLVDQKYAVLTDVSSIDNPLKAYDDSVVHHKSNRTELEQYVHQFAERSELGDKFDLLIKGARLARDHAAAMRRYANVFTEPEIELLDEKKELGQGFWRQSKFFRATIVTASLGGMIQGWTQSAINGTAYGMPKDVNLCIKASDDCKPTASDLWQFGMLMAIPLLSAGLFGTILADPLQENVLGRRGSIMLSCAITVASTIGASATDTVAGLAVCRMMNGIALGAKASIIPIYSAEMSPQHIRGAILANWQLADAAGLFLGCLANLLVVIYVSNPSTCWRVLTNTVLIPTVPLLIMIYLMPESPRYLMKHGKYRRALESFHQIQTTPLLASRDFVLTHTQLDLESQLLKRDFDGMDSPSTEPISHQPSPDAIVSPKAVSPGQHFEYGVTAGAGEPRDRHQPLSYSDGDGQVALELGELSESNNDSMIKDLEKAFRRLQAKNNPYSYHIGVTGYFGRMAQLWKVKRCRRALLCASVAMISQQLTGVNAIAVLGTVLWESLLTPHPPDDKLVVQDPARNAKVAAIIGLAFGAANYLGGLPAYWLSDRIGRSIMLALGLPNLAWTMLVLAFMFKIADRAVRIPMVSVFAVIFVLFYAPTAGTSPFSIAAEVFPLVTREAGMAVSVAVNLLGAGMLVLVFPFVLNNIGPTGALSIFAVLNVVAFLLVYLLCPETRMRKLEELQDTFDLSTWWHIEYRAVYVQEHLRSNVWNYLRGKHVKPPLPFYRWAVIFHGDGVMNSQSKSNCPEA